MSREGFSDFLNSAEHSLDLRIKLKGCETYNEVIDLALKYGFNITINDIKRESSSAEIENWFKNSKINPIRRIHK